MTNRDERYFINSTSNSFNTTLKGLTVIELNVSEICTRTCSFCPRSDKNVYKNQKKFMSLNTVSNIADNCLKHSYDGDFHISGFGEPTSNKEILDIIRHLRAKIPNRIAMTTNGDLLDLFVAKELLLAGLSYLIISCYDGPEAKNNFIKILQDAGYDPSQYNIRELWKTPQESHDEFLDRNLFNNRAGGVKDSRILNNFKTPCYLPFYKMIIDWNGKILLCCNDWFKRENNLGNINESDLADIWYSNNLTNIRKKLISGNRKEIESCQNCNIQGNKIGKPSVKILNY